MRMRKLLAGLLSFLLVFSTVPTMAFANEGAAAVEYRVNDATGENDEPAWTSLAQKPAEAEDEAEDEAADQASVEQGDGEAGEAAPVTKLEVRLANVDELGGVTLQTLTNRDEGTEWQVRTADDDAAFVDLMATLDDELASAYELEYRVHAGGAWLAWVKDGEQAAPENGESIDDVQFLLSRRAADESDEQTDEAAPADDEQENSAAGERVVAKAQDEAVQTETAIETEAAVVAPTVTYKAHVQKKGWMREVSNGAVAGTTGESKRVEALQIWLAKDTNGGISYQAHVQSRGWMNEVSNGAVAGTTGESKRVEALRISLTGEVAKTCDVWYRAHVQSFGWMNWVKNGEVAGTTGLSKRVEAIQVVVVPKGGTAPSGDAGTTGAKGLKGSISYRGNVEGFGWMGWVSDGSTAGSTGISAKLEKFSAALVGTGLNNGDLHYSGHVQTYGWMSEATGGQEIGVAGKRLEAVKMYLTGEAAQNFDVYYRCHIQTYGWLNWAKNGDIAGSEGMSKRVEAIQVVLVPKGGSAPRNDSGRNLASMRIPALRYKAHVQTYGWMNTVGGGATAGTTGQSKRVEALQVWIDDARMSGEIQVKTHVQKDGWGGWTSQGGIAGTTRQGKRLEALQIQLTGELAQNYDVWYRVHAQTFGWMGWAKNGEKAGTEGYSKRLEAVQIKLLAKGSAAPGSTNRPYTKQLPAKLGYQNPAGYYQVSSRNVTITSAAVWPHNYITPSRIGVYATREDCVEAFCQRAREYLGTPYMWDYSSAPGVGVDCIGLVYQCAYACGMNMGGGTSDTDFNPWAHYITGPSGWHSHDANNFWNYAKVLRLPLSARRRGDVISWPGHAAVYMGNDTVIEAVTGGVVQRSMWASGTPRGVLRLFQ